MPLECHLDEGHWKRMQSDRFWIGLILLLTAPAYFLTLQDGHHWGGDFAVYLQQARNVAAGEPIAAHQYAVTPRAAVNHPAIYPPVPSVLVAPIYASMGLNYRAIKAALALFWWLALPIWYLVGRRTGLRAAWSAGAMLAFGFGSLPLALKETIGSDGVFLFLSASAVLLLIWVEEAGWTVRRPALAAASVAAILLLSYATRATAAALLGAAVAGELWRTWESRPAWRFRAYGFYLLLFLAVGFLVYTKAIYDTRGQYSNQFVLDWRIYRDNLLFYFRMPAALWSSSPTALRYLLSGLAMVCGLFSIARAWRRPAVMEFYVLAFWAMVILYFVYDYRYSLPMVAPLLLLASRWLQDYLPRPAAFGLAALLAIAAVLNVRAMVGAPLEPGPHLATFREVTQFLRQAPQRTVLLSWNPRLFAYYTQQRSALYPRTPEEWAREIPFLAKQERARQFYLVAYRHELDQQLLGPHLSEPDSRLTPIFRNSDFVVYRLPD